MKWIWSDSPQVKSREKNDFTLRISLQAHGLSNFSKNHPPGKCCTLLYQFPTPNSPRKWWISWKRGEKCWFKKGPNTRERLYSIERVYNGSIFWVQNMANQIWVKFTYFFNMFMIVVLGITFFLSSFFFSTFSQKINKLWEWFISITVWHENNNFSKLDLELELKWEMIFVVVVDVIFKILWEKWK